MYLAWTGLFSVGFGNSGMEPRGTEDREEFYQVQITSMNTSAKAASRSISPLFLLLRLFSSHTSSEMT